MNKYKARAFKRTLVAQLNKMTIVRACPKHNAHRMGWLKAVSALCIPMQGLHTNESLAIQEISSVSVSGHQRKLRPEGSAPRKDHSSARCAPIKG